MPISVAPTHTALRIVKLLVEDKTKQHLENLGITVGAEITVLSTAGGSIICIVKDGRLALDKNIAMKIFVA